MPRLKTGFSSSVRQHFCDRVGDYVTALTWSPDGKYLAVSAASGEVVVWTYPDWTLYFRQQLPVAVAALSFAASGDWLAIAGQAGFLRIMSMAKPELLISPNVPTVQTWIDRMAWSPVQVQLAFNVDRQVFIWSQSSQTVERVLDFESSSVLGLAWHPKGDYLSIAGHTGSEVWQTTSWDKAYFLEVPGASLCNAWSPDGQYLAAGNFDHTLSVYEWETPPPWLMQGFPGKVREVVWSPIKSKAHGYLLATACLEGITVWWRKEDLWESRTLLQHQNYIRAISFQPNSLVLASAGDDGVVYLWEQAKKPWQKLGGAPSGFTSLSWHPQGRYLAAGGNAGEVIAWSVN
ncbi:MAG: WD40 repeat domain-containing protein [Cyanobacteria bacterium P01_H01_bin.15]